MICMHIAWTAAIRENRRVFSCPAPSYRSGVYPVCGSWVLVRSTSYFKTSQLPDDDDRFDCSCPMPMSLAKNISARHSLASRIVVKIPDVGTPFRLGKTSRLVSSRGLG